jgi:hypothetical protein
MHFGIVWQRFYHISVLGTAAKKKSSDGIMPIPKHSVFF